MGSKTQKLKDELRAATPLERQIARLRTARKHTAKNKATMQRVLANQDTIMGTLEVLCCKLLEKERDPFTKE